MLYIICCEMQEKNRRFFSCISQKIMYNMIYPCSEDFGMAHNRKHTTEGQSDKGGSNSTGSPCLLSSNNLKPGDARTMSRSSAVSCSQEERRDILSLAPPHS